MSACTAIFVRWKLRGGYDVWQGSTEVDEPVPEVGSRLHYGVFTKRGDALCEAHDVAGLLPVIHLPDETLPPPTIEELQQEIDRLRAALKAREAL